MTRGNQREIDRARAQARAEKHAGNKNARGGDPKVSPEADVRCDPDGDTRLIPTDGGRRQHDKNSPRATFLFHSQLRNEQDALALAAKIAAKAAAAAAAAEAGGAAGAGAAPKPKGK
jgi:hypothetical protein